jgi:hypothetical protein
MKKLILAFTILLSAIAMISCTSTTNQNGVQIRQQRSLWDIFSGYIIMNEQAPSEDVACEALPEIN